MQFGYTILYVKDVKATLAFYEAAFGLTASFLHDVPAALAQARGQYAR